MGFSTTVSGQQTADSGQSGPQKSGAPWLRFLLFLIFQMSDSFVRNVMAVLHALPVDFGDAFVGFSFCFFQCGGQGYHVEDAAPVDYVFTVFLYGACMEYDAACFFRIAQSGDDFAGGVGSGIAFGGHDYVYGTALFSISRLPFSGFRGRIPA